MAECNCWLLVSIGDHSFKTEIRELKEILYMIGNHKALESFQNVIWITSIYMNTGKFWTVTLIDYYGADKLRLCPEAAWWHMNDTGENAGVEFLGSYGTNAWAHDGRLTPGVLTWGEEKLHWGRMSEGNAEVPLMLDCVWTAGYPRDTDTPFTKAEYEYWSTDPSKAWSLIGGNRQMNRFCVDRHDHLINASFMNGSTRSVHVEELWQLKWHRKFKTKSDIEIEW